MEGETKKEENTAPTESKQSTKPNKYRGLKPFKKGQSGNPKGRAPGSVSITSAIKAKLNQIYKDKQAKITGDDGKPLTNKEKRTYLQAIIDTIFENALVQKDARTLHQIWAYIDGHPKATIDIGVDKTQLDELTAYFRGVAKPKENKK